MNYLKTTVSQYVRLIIPIIFSFILLICFPANAQEGTLKWSIDIGEDGEGISSPVVGVDGTIYVESGDDLYAINPDGTEKWVLPGVGTPQAIGDDNTIYAGSLHAINPFGTQKWELSDVGAAPAIGADGTIYTRDAASLFAINPNGTRKWIHTINVSDIAEIVSMGESSRIIVGADGTIYLVVGGSGINPPFDDFDWHALYAINSDGSFKWKFVTTFYGSPTRGGPPAIGSDGTIYTILAGGYYAGDLHAVNPDGSQKWSHGDNVIGWGHTNASSLTIGVDGTIYLQSDVGPTGDSECEFDVLIAVNPDGTTKWCWDDGGGWAPAVGDDGTIYAGPGETATMYALNPNSTKKWEIYLGSNSSELAIGGDGTIYVGISEGQPSLKAINSSSTGLANSSWPMFMHDERHTGRATETVQENLAYTPVTPCRIVDTRRTSAGIIGASTQRNFHVFGDDSTIGAQGGNSAGCPAPMGEPLAAHINMIAVNPTGKGNLQAFPVSAGTGAGLSVNYNAIDTNLANAGTVKTVTGSGADITVASNFSSTHTVIDVLGYYYPGEGYYYIPADPCRIADTRKTSAGIIGASTQRDFRVFGPVGDQGGNPAGCPSTLDVSPEAVHINMVAVNPTGKGNLQAFPVGAGTGAGLSVNYNTIDTNLANAGTVKTSPDITVASNFSSAHTVIDVLGYYSEEEDLLYTPVIPCRIVDTRRTSAGIIGASTQRNFHVFGDDSTIGAQGGNSAGCPAPLGQPLAAHINMVVVNPTGKGNLQAFPVSAGTGAGLSVNYNAIDTNLANAGTVKTVTGPGPDISVASNFSSAHTVIDVLGYYYPAP